MTGIEVQVTEQGPTEFRIELVFGRGDGARVTKLERGDEMVDEVSELAFEEVLAREVRPLPAGAIRVRVDQDEFGHHPANQEVAHAVARTILA